MTERTKCLWNFCPAHPTADVVHEWQRTRYHISGGESGTPLDTDHHYYCSVCGRELTIESEVGHEENNPT